MNVGVESSFEVKARSADDRSSARVDRFKVVIVGGGVSGLSAAHALIQRAGQNGDAPVDVLLLEASARFGGIVHTEERDGFLLERGPDSFISEKPEAASLARRIGLADNLIGTNAEHRRSFIVRGGKLRGVPEGFRLIAPTQWKSFLRSDAFSARAKARIALDLVLPRKRKSNDEAGDADESLADFIRRRFGREALERMAQPMVGGIYTADPEQLSLRATMPRFLDLERDHRSVILGLRRAQQQRQTAQSNKSNGTDNTADDTNEQRGTSGARYSLFLSFDRGMGMLTDRLAARLPPGVLRLNTAVDSLAFDRAANLWHISTNTGETIAADAVCLALPAHHAARLLHGTDATLADELASIPYASTATINLAYPRASVAHALDGFGFVVPAVERRAVLACTFGSVKFKNRAPEGHVLLRAFVGGALQPEMFALDDAEMLRRVRRDLAELIGARGEPLFTSVERWRESMAQYTIGHLDRLSRIRDRLTNIPSLHLIGNAYDGAGIPDCIRRAEATANTILESRKWKGEGRKCGHGLRRD